MKTKWMALFLLGSAACLSADDVKFKKRCLEDLIAQVPSVLASQDSRTGRFGTGIWIVTDQNVMLALAAAWSTKGAANRYYHDAKVLDSIMAAGDALIEDADETGQWVFRKKDGSTWGKIYMPWIYSRWIRTYGIVRDAMPAERRARWEKALRLGYSGISRQLRGAKLVNIPAHHAMGLYFAGQLLNEPEWKKQAAEFLHRVVADQHPDGYWSEHVGPVVMYNTVYCDALGVYYAASGDQAVLDALRKAATFHAHFTYPDGTLVETIDERNPHLDDVWLPNAGMTMTEEGRTYTARLLGLQKTPLSTHAAKLLLTDTAALLLLYGKEGPGLVTDPLASNSNFVLGKGDAAVRRNGPWFLAVSALTAPLAKSRWIQDRQNFFSVYHDRAGLILGGGNTKLQPRWSTFTIGDVNLLRHKAGDENPSFAPGAGLLHIPNSARLIEGKRFGVELDYAGKRGTVELKPTGSGSMEIVYSGDKTMTAHLQMLPRMGKELVTATGKRQTLDATPLRWTRAEAGEWIELAGVRVRIPKDSTVIWPVVPHDPYKKDGRAEPDQGRIVIDMPLAASGEARVAITIR
ncbi:MAG: hypothetical protein LLG20_15365 [Acidobacteriales bacterium]|nr:hypothetical protein [Terriglobales bacterium]